MIVLGILYVFAMGVFIGWSARGYIADREHSYRWWVEGCRHNIEERWRRSAPNTEGEGT